MYKKYRFLILSAVALGVLALILPFSVLISPIQKVYNESDEVIVLPWGPNLKAEIISPPSGTPVEEGICFDVKAKVRVYFPLGISSGNSFFQIAKPVFACLIGAYDIHGIIEIKGPAILQNGQKADVFLSSYLDPEEEASTTWRVCCTGPGNVTITVRPYGLYCTQVTQFSPALGKEDPICPVPDIRLESASITINQFAKPVKKPFSESSWSMPPNYTWPMPANTRVTNAWVQPTQILAGQPVKIFANISNDGDVPGSFTASLIINDQVETTQKVSVPANAAKPIEFTVVKDTPGIYEANLNGKKVYFTVEAAPAVVIVSPQVVPGNQPAIPAADNPGTSNTVLISYLVMGLLILVTLGLLLRYLTTR